MRKIIAAIVMTGLVGHAFAQTQPQDDQDQNRKGAAVMPGAADASEAAAGNLTPLYIGAGVLGAAVIAGAMSGGDGHCDHVPATGGGSGGTGGTGGTTGTTGTH